MFALLKQDIFFQLRHKFYLVYTIVTVVYIAILSFIPLEWRKQAAALVILTDPGTLGLFFVGTIIMLERNQQLLTYLFITPVRLIDYLVSKWLSLFVIAWLTSACIAYLVIGPEVELGLFSATMVSCCLFFTSCGVWLGLTAKGLNHFLVRCILLLLLLFMPLVDYYQVVSIPLSKWMPSYSTLFLLESSLGHSVVADGTLVFHLAILLGWGLLAFFVVYHTFQRYIKQQVGNGEEIVGI